MPFTTVRLRPGVNVEATQTLNEAGITTSQLVRFKGGFVQKIGGWAKFFTGAVTGIPRALLAWQDLNGNKRLGIGATASLSVVTAGVQQSITPQTFTTNSAINFSTVGGAPTITIVDANLTAALTTFDTVTINTPVAVAGLILTGIYPVTAVLSTTSYTITASANATATVTNGGAVPVFTATTGSSSVAVTLAAHNLAAGSTLVLPVLTMVGGLSLFGSLSVSQVVNANAFNVSAPAQATSSASAFMNGGNAQFVYGITLGPAATGTPYGFGVYGSGTYGGVGASGVVQTGTALAASDWTLDNWGELLIACPKGGAIYYWGPSGSFVNATPITQGPQYNAGVFISARYQILVAFGSTPLSKGIGVAQDPLFVRWCDQSNFFQWTATSGTQAGSYRIPTGSQIVAGFAGPIKEYLWTDLDLYSMDYIGYPLVFGFNKVSGNCGIVGAHAFATLSSNVYWMGYANFFVSSGNGVSTLPCTVWDAVFQDLDLNNVSKITAWSNTAFTEVWWYYPSISGGIGECDKYVKYNAVEQTWDYGALQRSAAIDQSVLGAPIAASRGGGVYLHETGADGDGSPINSSFETGFFQIGDGEDIVVVDRIYPDMKWGPFAGSSSASVQITVKATNFPGDTPRVYGPYTVTQATEFVPVRIRGRQIAMNVQSNDSGSFWRMGAVRLRFQGDGRR